MLKRLRLSARASVDQCVTAVKLDVQMIKLPAVPDLLPNVNSIGLHRRVIDNHPGPRYTLRYHRSHTSNVGRSLIFARDGI